MNKILKNIFFSLIIAGFLVFPSLLFAQTTTKEPSNLIKTLSNVAGKGGYETNSDIASTPKIAGLIIGAFIGFLGLTFIILMIFAGFKWMTANGNDEEVKKAKATIKQSLIGLVVAISGYTIWNFVFQKLIQ